MSQPTDIEHRLLSTDELQFRDRLRELALIISQIDRNHIVREEIKRNKESFETKTKVPNIVVLKDLLFDDSVDKMLSQGKYRTFRAQFYRKISKSSSTAFATDHDLEEFIEENDLVLYLLYAENFDDKSGLVTTSYTPLDNDDVGEGFVFQSQQGNQTQQTITVNDAYAQRNETQILGTYSSFVETCDLETAITCSGGPGSGGSIMPGPSENAVKIADPGEFEITWSSARQLKVGYVNLKRNFDGLFAGDNEVKMVFSVAVRYTQDGPLYLEPIKSDIYIKRSDVTKWRYVNDLIFDDWYDIQLASKLYTYEADGGGTTRVSLGAQVNLVIGEVNAAVEASVSKSRDAIGQRIMTGSVFFPMNLDDNGDGRKHDIAWNSPNGFSIWSFSDHFEYTLPHRNYAY